MLFMTYTFCIQLILVKYNHVYRINIDIAEPWWILVIQNATLTNTFSNEMNVWHTNKIVFILQQCVLRTEYCSQKNVLGEVNKFYVGTSRQNADDTAAGFVKFLLSQITAKVVMSVWTDLLTIPIRCISRVFNAIGSLKHYDMLVVHQSIIQF